jgi:ABC-type multidrug transport system fused ATPase/permease subunit
LVKLKERGRTILIVAHRPSALRTADKVLVLKEGCVGANPATISSRRRAH